MRLCSKAYAHATEITVMSSSWPKYLSINAQSDFEDAITTQDATMNICQSFVAKPSSSIWMEPS